MRKQKKTIAESLQKLNDDLVLAKHQGNTKKARLIELCIKKISNKSQHRNDSKT